jgi:hypothetical protein
MVHSRAFCTFMSSRKEVYKRWLGTSWTWIGPGSTEAHSLCDCCWNTRFINCSVLEGTPWCDWLRMAPLHHLRLAIKTRIEMETATYLLFVIGVMGAFDIAFFHSVSHGIRSHPDSVSELITHSLRGPTYAALFILIPNFQLHGIFAWGLVALFVFDVGISVWDFWVEQASRRFFGGLPSGEYVLHILLAMVFGAFVTSSVHPIAGWMKEPAGFVYAPANVPWVLRLVLAIMGLLVLISGIQDAFAVWRLRGQPKRVIPLEAALFPAAAQPRLPGAPQWMKTVLLIAGAYNIVWGSLVVLFPELPFRWAAMPMINYPEVWQCVGMVVGVYGVGYIIASRAPFIHWPIVLVGFLGKVLGPIGMTWAVLHHRLPAIAALACLTNDVVWWLPFALILVGAYQCAQKHPFHLADRK